MKLSVVIITFNEERNIGRCIDSVKNIADEIIVLDSLSTDHTTIIAESKGAKVHQQPFLGYVEQKNKALDYCSHEFVLSLDADEAIDNVLENSIMRVKKSASTPLIYSMNRCTNYCGKFIRHGSWYPDRKIRLFKRSAVEWGGVNPHDKIILKENITVTHLKGDILHYSYNSIEEHVIQNNRFSTISAETLYSRGKRTSIFKLVVHPFWAFLVSFLIRRGFMDGFYGFVIALNVAHLSFLKHAKLYQKQKLMNRE